MVTLLPLNPTRHCGPDVTHAGNCAKLRNPGRGAQHLLIARSEQARSPLGTFLRWLRDWLQKWLSVRGQLGLEFGTLSKEVYRCWGLGHTAFPSRGSSDSSSPQSCEVNKYNESPILQMKTPRLRGRRTTQ